MYRHSFLGLSTAYSRKDKKDRNMPSSFTTADEDFGHVYKSKTCALFLNRDPMIQIGKNS